MQVAHYLAVVDKDEADLAVLIGGNDFRVYTLIRDAELEIALIQVRTRILGRACIGAQAAFAQS